MHDLDNNITSNAKKCRNDTIKMLDRPERAVIKCISKIDTDFVSANIFEYQKHIFHRLTVPEEIAAQKIRGAEGEAETLRQKERVWTTLWRTMEVIVPKK